MGNGKEFQMKLYAKLLLNDFCRMRWKSTVLFVFLCLSVAISAVVVLMLSELFLSINRMYGTAIFCRCTGEPLNRTL